MKLGGWTRLGILVSALWVVGIGLLVASQYQSATPTSVGNFVHYFPGKVIEKYVTIENMDGKLTTGDVV